MITFDKLWNSHPTILDISAPCSSSGKPNFSDQCAIRVGVALSACGFRTTGLPGVRHCWHHDKSSGHVLAAEELANGLAKTSIPGIQKLEKIAPHEFSDTLKGKHGIIFLRIIGSEA